MSSYVKEVLSILEDNARTLASYYFVCGFAVLKAFVRKLIIALRGNVHID